jgi:hypothetical protein
LRKAQLSIVFIVNNQTSNKYGIFNFNQHEFIS